MKPTEPIAKSIEDLRDPGYFDIGIGYGVINGASGTGKDDDADGILASFKGYPFGRWYSTTDTAEARLRLAEAVTAPIVMQRISVVGERVQREAWRILPDKTMHPIYKELQQDVTSKAGEELPQLRVGTELVPAVTLPRDVTRESPLEIASPPKPDALTLAVTYAELGEPTKYVVKVNGKNRGLVHRFSVFYGISVGKFSGGGVDVSANAFGLGFDVTPELAVLVGQAFFKRNVGGVEDADQAWFYGLSLNLNAFRTLVSAAND